MYKHILIPTDGSDLSKKAVQHGILLAKALNAKVTSIMVITPWQLLVMERELITDSPEEYMKSMEKFASKYLEQVEVAALAEGVGCDGLYVAHNHPYQAIIEAANNQHCDLIVMASHGRRGISAVLLGSETVKVLTHSTIPVLVFR